MKKSKILILLLVVCLVVGIMATGCKKDEVDKTPDPTKDPTGKETEAPKKDPITFTYFSGDQNQAPAEGNPVVEKVRELTGVTIEFEFLVGDLFEKMGTMISGQDLPDLMNPSQARALAMENGVFIDLSDKIGNYPNIKSHYEPYMDRLRKNSGESKDKIYLLDIWDRYYGDWTPVEHGGPGFWIQKAVLADAGYPIPKTVDEYFDLLLNYKEKYPEIDGQPTLGYEVLSYDWRSFCLKNPPQHLIGHPNDGDVVVDKETYEASLYQNTDYAKKWYKKLNEMYHKGLISAETFTQDYDAYLQKISQGRVLGMFDQGWNFQDGVNVLLQEEKYDRTYVPLPITFEGYTDSYMDPPTFVGGNGMGITTQCKDVERALEYIDYCLNEDVQKLLSWGIEGEHYHVDENGMFYRTEEQRVNARDQDWINKNLGDQLYAQFPKIQGIYSDGNWCDANQQPSEFAATRSEFDNEFLDKYGFKLVTEFLTMPTEESPAYYPVWGYTVPDGSDAQTAINELTDLENTYLPRIIIADEDKFDAAWDDYMARMEKINTQAYLDWVNSEIKARME